MPPRFDNPRIKDPEMVDKHFGRLWVLYRVPRSQGAKTGDHWMCLCKCGKFHISFGCRLRRDGLRSCGCVRNELAAERGRERLLTHGLSGTLEYDSWNNMMRRCYVPIATFFEHYGGRGIKVYEPWHSFENFLADVGPAPTAKHTIDRYPNNNGDYEPGNVRWATRSQQMLNNRRTVMGTLGGVTKPVQEWAKERGLDPIAIRNRVAYYGFTLEEALTIPIIKGHKRPKK
jgi:hypothetical protein